MTGMNPEVQTLWLEALRSGEYQQGTGQLNAAGKFCCLGVLCEVAIKAGVSVAVTEDRGYTVYDGDAHTPPYSVWEWAGLRNDNPEVSVVESVREGDPDAGHPLSIAEANDAGLTFDDLAEIIESEF